MLKNILKMALRSIKNNKVITSINIFGFAIGIAYATMILMWVDDEASFDRFHKNNEQIFRITGQRDSKEGYFAITPGLLAAALKQEIPEVKYAARVIYNQRNPFKYKDKAFYEDKSFCVDPDFFKMFSFPLAKGNSEKVYSGPEDIVISEETAQKYFGKENPIGKELNWNNKQTYKVSAVIKKMPQNSSLQMQLMESHTLYERSWQDGYNWTNFAHETYIMIKKNVSVVEVEKKIEKLLNTHIKFAATQFTVRLQPLNDLHRNIDISGGYAITSDGQYITIFLLIALGILLIACINFINIASAHSLKRAKEVGIRKVLGAERKKLIFQFIGEFSVFTFIGAFISVLTILFVLPSFNQFAGKELTFNLRFLGYYLLVVLFTGVIAGTYPAIYLSSFTPHEILKNKLKHSGRKLSWRSALVVFQFSISIFLIVSTFIVNDQLNFIQNKKLGFVKDNVLYIPAKAQLSEKYNIVKKRLLQIPEIVGVTMQDSEPTTTLNSYFVRWQGETRNDLVVRNTYVTQDYFNTMEIGLKEGRFFSDEFSTDKTAAFVLNEEAVRFLGLAAPIGMEISVGDRTGKIIGIAENSYFRSLHHKIDPLIFTQLDKTNAAVDLSGVILIKYKGSNIPKIISEVKSVWRNFNPDLPFEYHFLDQTIEQQYVFEQKLNLLFSWLSVLTITISVLGLLGLAILLMEQRTKEIGIRKVLGASVAQVVALLSKDFIKWVVVANIITWPLSYYFMNKWLQGFAYRIDIGVWVFLISGGIALLIAMATVSFQAIKAATANPVESLKYE